VLAAFAGTILYLPHVVLQWAGRVSENINQIGELATIWVVAVVCGWLIGREKHALREMRETNEGALLALIGTLDARKQKRKHHTMRVYAYASEIARKLGLPLSDIEVLAQTSVLHDIGMIAVPDRVLLKPGPLDDQEWAIIRKHPTIGFHILQRVPFLRKAAEIVHTHHEWFNGNGYPRGLNEGSIPYLARVFAVADVFDAITTDRRYCKALPMDEAREVIRNERGSRFDPEIVDTFLQISEVEWKQMLRKLEMRMSEMHGVHRDAAEALDAEIDW
jgi:putative nucleotidyltransferase with HDIG domain